jgi:8-oxo-dGTP diphosphatase
MPYTPIMATLGYAFNAERDRVLLVHRIARPGDAHAGKYNGLGGKLERNEDVVAGLIREFEEEAGITPTEVQLAGTISWPGFGKNGEDWFGFLFRIFSWMGELRSNSPEGPLEWVRVSDVLNLPLWPGDRLFLPEIFDFAALPFHGVMPYANGQPTGWQRSVLRA